MKCTYKLVMGDTLSNLYPFLKALIVAQIGHGSFIFLSSFQRLGVFKKFLKVFEDYGFHIYDPVILHNHLTNIC